MPFVLPRGRVVTVDCVVPRRGLRPPNHNKRAWGRVFRTHTLKPLAARLIRSRRAKRLFSRLGRVFGTHMSIMRARNRRSPPRTIFRHPSNARSSMFVAQASPTRSPLSPMSIRQCGVVVIESFSGEQERAEFGAVRAASLAWIYAGRRTYRSMTQRDLAL